MIKQTLKKLELYKVGRGNDSGRDEFLRAELAKLTQGGRILDAGAGQLRFKPYCSHLKYFSQDFGQYDGKGDGAGLHMGTWDQSKVDFICDITAIPQPDASFDAILCTEVFEHLPDPLAALREFSRLLKPGGKMIITVPFASLTHFAPYHFYSGFNRYFFETHLPKMGFELTELKENGNYFEYIAQEVWRLREMSPKYTGRGLRFYDYFGIGLVLNMLARLSKGDRGSKELLCYGLGVIARKRG